MSTWIIRAGLSLVFGFMVFNGFLMLVVPARHRRFLAWFGRSDSWSRRVPGESQFGLELERRLAGLGMLGMGIYVLSNIFANETRVKTASGSIFAHSNAHSNLPSVLMGLFLLGVGAFVSIRPDLLVEWSMKHQPVPSEIPDSNLALWKKGARVLGAAFLLGGGYVLWLAVR